MGIARKISKHKGLVALIGNQSLSHYTKKLKQASRREKCENLASLNVKVSQELPIEGHKESTS